MVSLTLDSPPAITGSCNPTRVHFTGHITSDAPGKVTYTWVRPNHPAGRTETLTFTTAGTLPVTYDVLIRKSEQGWVMLRIVLPQQTDSAKIPFRVKCP
jgi:hypothetical protein